MSRTLTGGDYVPHGFGPRAYALSNQWSLNTISVVDEVIARQPSGGLSYVKETSAV